LEQTLQAARGMRRPTPAICRGAALRRVVCGATLLAYSTWAGAAACAPFDPSPAGPAAPVAAPTPPPRPAEWRWYGWQILLSDVAGLSELAVAETLAAGAASSTSRGAADVVFAVGVSQFVLGGAVVHASHRQWVRAALSIGERLLLPATGFALGFALAPRGTGDQFNDPFPVAALGLLAGILVAHVVDAAVLSTIPPRASDPGPATAPTTAWAPVVLVAPDARDRAAAFVLVVGRF
jgi:hypothetical protein